MNFFAGFRVGAFDGFDQLVVERVQTVGIPTDTREIRRVTDAREPQIKLVKIKIRAEESGHDNDGRTVALRHAETEINRRNMQRLLAHFLIKAGDYFNFVI